MSKTRRWDDGVPTKKKRRENRQREDHVLRTLKRDMDRRRCNRPDRCQECGQTRCECHYSDPSYRLLEASYLHEVSECDLIFAAYAWVESAGDRDFAKALLEDVELSEHYGYDVGQLLEKSAQLMKGLRSETFDFLVEESCRLVPIWQNT